MRSIILLSCFLVIAAASLPKGVNDYKPGDRYVYFPDGDGDLHLIDLQPEEILPLPRIDINRMSFFLFTRNNPTQRQQIYVNDFNGLGNSYFDPSRPTKVLVHGWRSSVSSGVNTATTHSTLQHHDANVIVFDWSYYAGSLNYFYSARTVGEVGQRLAEFLDYLITAGSPASSIHLIGFSLGGHVIGNAARHLRLGRLPLITSLDPAGPIFGPENNERVQPDDADVVEVIHTNGDGLGNGDQLGTIDHYPNGGRSQPGCLLNPCSHSRAYELYAESVFSNGFIGTRCNDINEAKNERCSGNANYVMGGGWANKNWGGIFHLTTNNRSPFARY